MQALARYWGNDYNLGRVEERLNAFPQFMTEIDGLDIHFIQVRSKHEDALPLILTHGWPGSVIEMLDAIGPLTDPESYGGRAQDAFHVVIPSIPGYGYSERPGSTGWDPDHIARAWGLIGIHSNMPGTVPPDVSKVIASNVLGAGDPRQSYLSDEESRAFDQLTFMYTKGIGYAVEMGLHPQTLYGLADSPIGLAAWMLDHDAQSYDDISMAFVAEEAVGSLDRDTVLDNITLTWLTNTGISSARLYWENKLGFFDAKGMRVPAAVSVFPHELYQAPRSWTEQAYPNLVYFNEVDKGNHFAPRSCWPPSCTSFPTTRRTASWTNCSRRYRRAATWSSRTARRRRSCSPTSAPRRPARSTPDRPARPASRAPAMRWSASSARAAPWSTRG